MKDPDSEVIAANEAFYEAFRRHDHAAMEALWALREPIVCVHPGWEALVGRADVLSSWRALLSGSSRVIAEFAEARVRVDGDTAVVTGVERMGGIELAATNVFVREGAAWKLVHHQAGQLLNRYGGGPERRTRPGEDDIDTDPPPPDLSLPPAIHRRAIGALAAEPARVFSPEREILEGNVERAVQAAEAAFAYDALRVSESHNRAIWDNMLSALFTVTMDGEIESVNPAGERMFGLTAQELAGMPFTHLFTPLEPSVDELFASALGRVTEWRGRRTSGDTFPFELRLFPVESLRGKGYAAIVQDISERYEVERLKGEIISIVSHELRTPLTALRGTIGLLVGGALGPLPDEPMEMLRIAQSNTQRLIALVEDILDLDRLQRGKLQLHLGHVLAARIVARSVDAVRAFADEQRVAIAVTCAEGDATGDEKRLVQVLVNLLSNAIKFSPPGSRVEVSTGVVGSFLEIRVKDQGRGVPQAQRALIFERFHQVHSSDARDKGGTGLGLAISRSLVEQHGGTIGVESEEGKGATFWFRVPRGEVDRPEPPAVTGSDLAP
jgi:PAS domain S-box-containing protein